MLLEKCRMLPCPFSKFVNDNLVISTIMDIFAKTTVQQLIPTTDEPEIIVKNKRLGFSRLATESYCIGLRRKA